MPIQTRLDQLSYNAQPVYYMEPSLTWEERLARAYDEAAAHIRHNMAPGQNSNMAKYLFAADVAGSDLRAHSASWEAGVEKKADPSLDAAIKWKPNESQEYYLGHFAQASENIGVFVSGQARKQVNAGALSVEDFEQACDLRLRSLSDIIYLGRTGALPALLDPDGWNQKHGASQDGRLIVATGGVGSPDVGIQGLGAFPVLGVVAVVGLLVGVAIGVGICMAAENVKQRRIALDICQQAIASGHKDAAKICKGAFEVVDKLSDPAKTGFLNNLIPPDLQKQVLAYAAIGLGGYLFVTFLPQIIGSVGAAQDRYSDIQLKRLKRLQEQRA